MTHTLCSRRRPFALLLGIAILGSGCPSDDDPVSMNRTPTVAVFAPSVGDLSLPNDLLFTGSVDGTLNPPIADPMNTSDPAIGLSTLDGWGTSAPMDIRFSRGLDPASVIGGNTVRVFEVTTFTSPTVPVGGPVVFIDRELVPMVEYDVSVATEYPGGSAVRITPLVPFVPSILGNNSVYMVVLTKDIRDTDDFRVSQDLEYFFASERTPYQPPTPPDLIQLQTLVGSQLTAYENFTSLARESVSVSFTFTTQSIGSGLNSIIGIAIGNEQAIINGLCAALGTCAGDTLPNQFSTPSVTIPVPVSIGTASGLVGGPPGAADAYVGVFTTPYYSTAAANTSFNGLTQDAAPLLETWSARYASNPLDQDMNVTRFNPLPNATGAENVPMLVTVPNVGMMPAGGWPIVIFQHGIGQNRTNVLAIAETFAMAGFATVAIDLPLHGVDATTGQLTGINIFSGYDEAGSLRERTFGLDLFTEGSGQVPSLMPDGNADSSGIHYINLQNLAVTRDNLQQGVADLINLRVSLVGLTLGGMDVFDETNVHFVGHSLGGIVGATFVALQPGLSAATIGMAGGSFAYLLNGSAVFGPVIQASLAIAGVLPGTPEYSQFLFVAQTIADSGDPINYAQRIALSNTPIYLTEIVGGGLLTGSAALPDLVVPNSVAGAPLAGTEPLIRLMGLQSVSMSAINAGGLQATVRFIEGDHSSLISPGFSAGTQATFAEIQGQLASFHASLGTVITVTNTGVVLQ